MTVNDIDGNQSINLFDERIKNLLYIVINIRIKQPINTHKLIRIKICRQFHLKRAIEDGSGHIYE